MRVMAWPKGTPRDTATRAKIGKAQRGRTYPNRSYGPGTCRTCGRTFDRRSARHWFCSAECKAVAHYEMRAAATDAEYRSMLRAQGNRCAICRTPDPGGPATHNRFYVDHDHATGTVRGLLCLQCNLVLGLVGDDAGRLARMVKYLRR